MKLTAQAGRARGVEGGLGVGVRGALKGPEGVMVTLRLSYVLRSTRNFNFQL